MKRAVISLAVASVLAISANAFTLKKYGEFSFKKDHDNVYIMHGPIVEPNVENEGFMNNPTIIEAEHGLIIVDPGGNYNVGKKILTEIEKVSKKPIIAVINTHKHGDHWFANKNIAKKYPKVKIYAQKHMIEEVKAGEAENWYNILDGLTHNLKGTKEFEFPTIDLLSGDILEIDGQKFYIYSPKDAHTDTDLIIVHDNSKTLFLADNVMKGRLGAFDGSSSILGNIELLEKILAAPELTTYIPGHGISGKRDETIKPFLTYLKTLTEGAKKALDEDLEAYEVKPEVVEKMKAYQKWDGFDHQMGKHLQKVYGELETLDEEE